ncbi:MAG TPA: metallophosphoesterase [Solirubrobacteraceae bacterium]|nr:metallophosphoesterase [Solirubrobacteraceae bacterium]
MKLHVISDLHLEHAPFTVPEVDADVAVLAGDIAPGTAGIEWMRRHLDGRPVMHVAGNHEFYGEDLPGLTKRLKHAAAGSQIHVLENDEVVIHGVRFLGCSLWTDFDSAGAENRANTMRICERLVNDYKQISASELDRQLRAQDTRDLHTASRAWLTERLAADHDGPTVVITHHAPLVRARPQNPLMAAVGGAFASDLSELMGAGVDLWIFGHIHRVVDAEVNGTRVLSNQRGYPHEPVAEFDPGLVVEV